jgi:hypothetical protein|tara:strand:- start:1222 stop:1458 length:237 start_codon:yes stop_codon:yes gene_type:complete
MNENKDLVNHPAHYGGGVECIEAIESGVEGLPPFQAVLVANVIKYLWRFHRKGKPVEDLKKAQWYLNQLIKKVEVRDE